MEALKYPIGKLDLPSSIHLPEVKKWIRDIENFPDLLRYEVEALTLDQLEWKYRPDGWCIRQVIHHCADSHMNSQMRFKLTLTENKPTIKPYEEALWAQLPDMTTPIQWSLGLLDVLHKRWVVLLESLTEADLKKEYVHPEHGRIFNLCQTVALYSWHCRHHLAHVKQAKAAKGSY